MAAVADRFRNAWNAFVFNKDPTKMFRVDYGASYANRPDRVKFTRGNERSIITAILNRIAIDVSQIEIVHVRLDEDDRYLETIKSDLNSCLNLEANIDQTGRAFRQDAVQSMLDEGSVCLVPTDTEFNPTTHESTKIYSMRTGKITQWYPYHVKIKLYNERSGRHEEIIMPKSSVCIIENPFYAVMNEQSSTLQRLIRKLNILDAIDEQSGSGKMDLIIQLPYSLKTPLKQAQAEERRKNIEMQLTGSKYGIAYIDSTEHVTQLNRSVDNNLMNQITYLTEMLYSQMGITQSILDGTADEKTMLNYMNRTIEPIVAALVDEMKRKLLSKTARTQGQSIEFFRDPFKLVPVSQMAEMADKMTRNEIMTSNEIRQEMGMKPSKDPSADELRNKNLSSPADENEQIPEEQYYEKEENQNG